jgi:short-subunit dehydrogenase
MGSPRVSGTVYSILDSQNPCANLLASTEMKPHNFALITGASRGLGMAFARELAQRRHNLVLVARSPEPLHAFASELRRDYPIAALAIPVDLSSCGAGESLAEQVSSDGIAIDLLVNNAGFGLRGEFRNQPLQRQLEMLRLNNQAVIELTYSLLPGMLELQRKGIINVSSTAGFQPIPFASAYAATKAFLTTFSLALEQELRSSGVSVVTVCPGRLRKNENASPAHLGRVRRIDIYQSPEEVVRDALRGLANGGGLTVPGTLNKFSVFAQRLIPRKLVLRMVARMSRA